MEKLGFDHSYYCVKNDAKKESPSIDSDINFIFIFIDINLL